MEYRNLGSAGIKVSPLTLGTMMFGAWGNRDHDESVRIIHRAFDAGINLIDTANIYSEGESEVIVGKAIRHRRQEVVLATKVYGPMGEGPHRRGLSRKAIQQEVEASLRRLDTEVIDLYQIHRLDPSVRWEEVLATLSDLVRQGKVRYIGCSSNHYDEAPEKLMLRPWQLVESLWVSERGGWERFISFQPPYSMLRRVMEAEHFPVCQRFGLGTMVWSPLEGGWLTGKYRTRGGNPGDSPRARDWVGGLDNPKFDRRLAVVEELAGMADAAGQPLAELALAWTLRHEAVTTVIIGPRTMEQLESCLRAPEQRVPEQMCRRLDELVPPGTTVL